MTTGGGGARRAVRSAFSVMMAAMLAYSLGVGNAATAYARSAGNANDGFPPAEAHEVGSREMSATAGERQSQSPDELVTIIVQLESEADGESAQGIVSAQGDKHARFKSAISMLAQDYFQERGAESQDGMLAAQDDANGYLIEVADYANAIDGFAVKAPLGILSDIRSLEGVKRAFVERVFTVGESNVESGAVTAMETSETTRDSNLAVSLANTTAAAAEGSSDLVAAGGLGIGSIQDEEDFIPKNASSLNMTGTGAVDQKGDGQVIAILDSGFDTSHDAFSGQMDESKVSWSQETAQLRRSACAQGGRNALYVSSKIPFAYDYGDGDSNVVPSNGGLDHGGHVAGIAGANGGETRGTAPNAQLALMKVANDFTGSIYESALIGALDDAVALKPDIVSMSLGSDGGFSADDSDTMNDIFAKLESQGANVCISSGNSYTSAKGNRTGEDLALASDPDQGIASSPATSGYVTAVASLENARDLAYVTAADGRKICYVDAERSEGASYQMFDTLADGTYEYVDAGYGTQEEVDALKAQYGNLRGKIAITEDRQVSSGQGIVMSGNRASNLDVLRPAAIVLYKTDKGSLEAAGVGGVSRPVICITNEDGHALVNASQKTITVKQGQFMAPTSDYAVNAFSSWGATPELGLKPEVAAPGGNIYSSVLNNKYGVKSGTSMAAPHFAGLCALMREYVASDAKFAGMSIAERRDAVTQLLMSTARPLKNLSSEDCYYSPRQQGAGSVDVSHAVATPVFLTVDGAASAARPKAELGESRQGTWEFAITLHNVGDTAQSYRPSAVALAEDVSDGMFQQVSRDWAGKGIAVTYGGPAYDAQTDLVSVPAGATATYTVSIACQDSFKEAMSGAVNGTFVDGFALLQAQSADGVDLSVPYLGFYGDWGQAPVFDGPAGSGDQVRRYESRIVNASTEKQLGVNPLDDSAPVDLGKAVVSTVNGTNAPNTLEPRISLLRGVRTLRFSYADADGNVVRSYSYDYVGKAGKDKSYSDNLTPKPVFTGTDDEGNLVPDGSYTLTVTAATAGPSSQEQSCSFPFVKDTQAPQVQAVTLEGQGDSAVVQVAVNENAFLAGIDFTSPASSERFLRVLADEATVVDNAGGTHTYTFDIPLSRVQQAWADAGNAAGEFPTTLDVTAWDFGLNQQASEGPATGDGLVVDETGQLTGYEGSATVVAIPAGVTGVAANAFKGSTVKAVSIPASVRTIGESAFRDTANLVQVAFEDTDDNPSQLTDIGANAFNASAVRDLTLPRSLTSLDTAVFAKSSLNAITLPESLRAIPALAFSESSVATVCLPAQLQDVGASAFASCRDLSWVGYQASGEKREGMPASTRTIGEDAFANSGLRHLVLNEGLVSIAADAFSGSSLDELVIPDSVTNLQKNAIANAKHLVKLVLGSGVTQVQAKDAVSGCESLQEINVSDSSPVLRAQDGVLFTADMSALVMYPTGRGGAYTMPDQVLNVGMAAFKGASATSVSLNAVTSIGDSAFEGSLLQAVDLGSVRSIGESAFASCANLGSIDFMSAQALESIGASAFSPSTPLQGVELSDAVSNVGSGAFANNSALRTVRLGASFSGEYSSVFAGCDNVENLQVSPGNALYQADGSVLYRKADDGLHLQRSLPNGKLSSYAVKEGTVAIGPYAFAGNDALESVVVPEGVKAIETAAFTGCTQLSQVSFPDSLETVTGFYDTALEFVELGTGIKEIKSSAFNGHNPSQLIVHGGQGGTYASSLEGTDEVQPMKSAYFGEGMRSADFTTSVIAPPSVVVAPSTMTSLKFNAPSTVLSYDPATVTVFAVKDTAGWKAAKAALESIGADPSTQLVPYQVLTVSAEAQADVQSGKTTVSAMASGGALAATAAADGVNALRTALEYRFVTVANDGSERIVQDWSEVATCTLDTDDAACATVRCEVRDATGITAETEVKVASNPTGDDEAAKEAAEKAAREAAEKAAREAAEKAACTVASAKVAKPKMTYTGKALKPAVTVTAKDGSTVPVDGYVVAYSGNVNVGVARVTVTGRGTYSGTATATFKVTKAAAKAKVVKSKSFKASTLKKGSKSFKAVKLTTDGMVAWKVVKKDAKKALTFKKGKVTVKKGAKAGTYTIKVKTSAKTGKNYKALAAKTYTIKVKVK